MDLKYEVKTDKPFMTAVEDLKKTLSNNSFGVLWELDFKDKLAEKGLDFQGHFKVLEVCNPKQAKEVLEIQVEVGYFLPCKVVVYEKENSVYMGMLRPTSLIGMLKEEKLLSIAEQVEEVIKKALDEAI
ncbi:hypothetical protein Desaci_3260 [Desulfosporosinus acidiphilus SJ4]|uniref:DUF302 domain-containing protein n=1 Tax=Desulfosporosinus acidiphilus (strain DSM 22704 / JCM 16185 / SJ4) TaxID=646529 RepID=I4D8N3_DESAJ|nr:DUF302 domain-containing protein [Desulfosporosinus acidiphilus]AFM42157.1 hypothetical protein Desaci_3260 [Desulfosporosinus acidiphilus SJ4]